jgi:hypothetical protein
MKATIEQIRTITPAAIAKIPIHFQIPPSSPSSGVMSLASCFSGPVVDLKYRLRPIAAGPAVLSLNPQQVLPVAAITLEAQALSDPKGRDHTPLDLRARLAGSFADSPIFSPSPIEVGNKSIGFRGCRLKQGQKISRTALVSSIRSINVARSHIVIFHDIASACKSLRIHAPQIISL